MCQSSCFGQIRDSAAPSGKGEVRPLLDLMIAKIFAVPIRDLAGWREPYFSMAFGIAYKFTQHMRPKRAAANEGMIAPDHEFRIRRSFFVKTIKTILPHLQNLARRASGPLVTGIVVEVREIG